MKSGQSSTVGAPVAGRAKRVRAVGGWILKALVTSALVAWVFSRIELRELASHLRASLGFWLLAAVVVGIANITVGALRWRLMLAALGSALPFATALRLIWAGLFFNTFLPSSLVGDAFRGAWTARLSDAAQAYWSVLLDRITAMGALALVVALGLLLPQARALPGGPTIAGACLLLGLPALLVVAMPERFARLLGRLGPKGMRHALTGTLSEKRPLGPRLRVLVLACLIHLLTILNVALLARAVELELPADVLFTVVPAVLLVSYLPVSISGIGVRDVALVELLGRVGVSPARSLTVSLLILATSVLFGLVGGLVYLASDFRKT